MKNKFSVLLILLVLLINIIPVSVFAASGPIEFTIDVRNRTGAPVEFNYRGSDGVTHWVTIPSGVSSLTLYEGIYSYWADPKCGHVAGTINLSQQRQILWISCDLADPYVGLVKFQKSGAQGLTCTDANDFGWYYQFEFSVVYYSETYWGYPSWGDFAYADIHDYLVNVAGATAMFYRCYDDSIAQTWTTELLSD